MFVKLAFPSITKPKNLLLLGLVLFSLGFSWFSGGPIKEALAQSESACQKVEILPEANKPANDSLTKVNVNALNIKLTCQEIVNVWKTLLGATDIVVALYLIAIAVATIFHIQYDTYSIKKTLPPLIVGVILANFSLFITRVMVDFASVLSVTFINAEGGQAEFLRKLIEGIYGNFGATIGAYINASAQDTPLEAFGIMFSLFQFLGGAVGLVLAIPLFFIGLIFTLVPAILIFFLALLFYARYYIVIALAVVSPLAFICLAFPPTQKYFQRWWQEAIKWIFMLPVSMFLLWLAIQMTKLVAGGNTSIGSYLVSLIFLYLAIKVPFGMGNIMGVDIGGKLGGLAKLASAGLVGAGIWAGWKGMSYGVGKLRDKAGAAAKRAQVARGNIGRLNTQLRGKFSGTYEERDEYRRKKAEISARKAAAIENKDKVGLEEAENELAILQKNYQSSIFKTLGEEQKALLGESYISDDYGEYLDKIKKEDIFQKKRKALQEKLRDRKIKKGSKEYNDAVAELNTMASSLGRGDIITPRPVMVGKGAKRKADTRMLEEVQDLLRKAKEYEVNGEMGKAEFERSEAAAFMEKAEYKAQKMWQDMNSARVERGKSVQELSDAEKREKRYKLGQEILSWLHLPGQIQMLKLRKESTEKWSEKELAKTGHMQWLAGPFAQREAGYAAYESVRHFTPEQTAKFLNDQILQKIDKHIYESPEKLAEFLRDLVNESQGKMITYVNEHSKIGRINDFTFNGMVRGAEQALRYLGGQPALRDEFSRSLQAVSSIGGDPGVLAEYTKAGGTAGLVPINPNQINNAIIDAVSKTIAQQGSISSAIEDLLISEMMSAPIGRAPLRDNIHASIFRAMAGGRNVLAQARESIRIDVKNDNRVLNDVTRKIDTHVIEHGLDQSYDVRQKTTWKDEHDGLSDKAIDEYLHAARTRQFLAKLLLIRENPGLFADKDKIIARLRELIPALSTR